MSRRITIATKFNNPEILAESLNELSAKFTQDGTNFRISEGIVDHLQEDGSVERFRYTGVQVDTETGQGGFDEDCSLAKRFIEGPLAQVYSKNLFLQEAGLSGDVITEEYVTSDAMPFVEGYVGDVPLGSYVFVSDKPFYG
jgi:hypothetical protein